MRMRTIPEAAKELAKADPETALTLTRLRKLIKSGGIRTVPYGKRVLVDVDELLYGAAGGKVVARITKAGVG